jgi:hypothetical protein
LRAHREKSLAELTATVVSVICQALLMHYQSVFDNNFSTVSDLIIFQGIKVHCKKYNPSSRWSWKGTPNYWGLSAMILVETTKYYHHHRPLWYLINVANSTI